MSAIANELGSADTTINVFALLVRLTGEEGLEVFVVSLDFTKVSTSAIYQCRQNVRKVGDLICSTALGDVGTFSDKHYSAATFNTTGFSRDCCTIVRAVDEDSIVGVFAGGDERSGSAAQHRAEALAVLNITPSRPQRSRLGVLALSLP